MLSGAAVQSEQPGGKFFWGISISLFVIATAYEWFETNHGHCNEGALLANSLSLFSAFPQAFSMNPAHSVVFSGVPATSTTNGTEEEDRS